MEKGGLIYRHESKQYEDWSRQTQGLLVVDAHVLFAVISFEPGLPCCLPSDSSRSVDILLLFVHGKVVHFPCIKSAFTHVCQDVFSAYLQLLSGSGSRVCAQERDWGGRGAEGCFVPEAFFLFIYFLVKARTGSKAVSAHANTHQYTHTNKRSSTFSCTNGKKSVKTIS